MKSECTIFICKRFKPTVIRAQVFCEVDSRHLYYLREVGFLGENLACPQTFQNMRLAKSRAIGRNLRKMLEKRDDCVFDFQIGIRLEEVSEIR